MRIVVIFLALGFMFGCGSLWALYDIAFGDARISGVNVPAAMTLVSLAEIMQVLVIVLMFHAFDWINDSFAARSTRKAVQASNKDMSDLFKVQTHQARALQAQVGASRAFDRYQPPVEGGLEYEDNIFQEPLDWNTHKEP